MPEILYCDLSFKPVIDEIGEIFSKKIGNKEIFLLAMALGIDNPTKIKKRYTFVRHSYLRKDEISLIYTCAWKNLGHDVNSLLDEKVVYDMAEQCANTGFRIISNHLKDSQHQLFKKLVLDTLKKYPQPDIDDGQEFEDIS